MGVVVYEMLTGKRPFVGKTPAGLIAAILTETPPPPAQLQPLVPLPLNHVVATCLARDPDRRWQSVRDVALSLKANSETSSTVSDVIAGRRGSWREGIAWVAAGIGLLVALATWASTSFAPAPPQPAAPVRATIPFAAGQRLAVHETPAFAVSPDGSTLAYVVTDVRGRHGTLRAAARFGDGFARAKLVGRDLSAVLARQPEDRVHRGRGIEACPSRRRSARHGHSAAHLSWRAWPRVGRGPCLYRVNVPNRAPARP